MQSYTLISENKRDGKFFCSGAFKKETAIIFTFSIKSRILCVNLPKMRFDKYDIRRKLSLPQDGIPASKQLNGSTKDKHPVFLDGGKTVIFISDKDKEQETIEKYKTRGYKRP